MNEEKRIDPSYTGRFRTLMELLEGEVLQNPDPKPKKEEEDTHTDIAIIARIEPDGDRTLLYPIQKPSRLGEWYIIADSEKVAEIQPGDKVVYQPDGINFGWFVSKA